MNEIVERISQTLNETNPIALTQIERVVNLVGEESALEWLEKTIAIESDGGMLTNNKKRRRTAGGVFFYLVKGSMPSEQRKEIFIPSPSPEGKPKKKPPIITPYAWDDRIADFNQFNSKNIGEASVEIKIIGNPIKIVEKKAVTIVVLRSNPPGPMPKGLPKPPVSGTNYLIIIAQKQWRKIKENIAAGERLLVTGYPIFDPGPKTITVLAQSAQTIPPKGAKKAAAAAEQAEPVSA